MDPETYDRSTKLLDPHVSHQGRRAHLRYDVHQRLNTSKVYPLRSHRGSEIIVSGTDDGLRIIWRGGKPLQTKCRYVVQQNKKSAGGVPHKSEWNGPVSVHKRDQAGVRLVTKPITAEDRPGFETEDAELDEDEICVPFTQELLLSLGSPVLDIAIPSIPPPSTTGPVFNPDVPIIMQANIVLVATCADSSVRLIAIPLTPPSASAKRAHTLGIQICDILPAARTPANPRAVALTWTSNINGASRPHVDDSMEDVGSLNPKDQRLDLVVALSIAGIAGTLEFFRITTPFEEHGGAKLPSEVRSFQTVQLSSPANHISFNSSVYPSPKHSQLLLADAKGYLRVYDPLAPESSRSRPSSRESAPELVATSGAWIIAFASPFHIAKETSRLYPGLAQRKSILDARWVSGGRSVLVLLDDGEWGVWSLDAADLKSTSKGNASTLNNFVIRGFIGQGSAAETAATPESRTRTNQRLAPMTPNTRKTRQESLFTGPINTSSGNIRRGGISVTPTSNSHGAADDVVVMWYGGEGYHIPSLGSLWQRSVSSSGRDIGSLYGPGLARIEGLDMNGEILNNIEQFPPRSVAASAGNITHRDFLITGEYRLIISTTTRPQMPARTLFARDTGSPTPAVDLQLLEKGELDLGGVDRLLDGMGGVERPEAFGRPKRVGFAW